MTGGEWATLAAKQAITELITLYAHAIDRRDEDLLTSLFTADARLAYGVFEGTASELIAWRRAHSDAGYRMTHHATTNVLIQLDGEAAAAQSYLNVVHRGEREGVAYDEHVRARYLDRLLQIDGRWLFAERTLVFDWSWCVRADDSPWWSGRPVKRGARGADDPSARLLGDLRRGLP